MKRIEYSAELIPQATTIHNLPFHNKEELDVLAKDRIFISVPGQKDTYLVKDTKL